MDQTAGQPDPIMTDDELREHLLARLAANPRTRGADLRVGVLNGIIHLAGSAADLAACAAAEDLARQVPGVRGVVNRIEAPGAPSPSRTIHIDLAPDEPERS